MACGKLHCAASDSDPHNAPSAELQNACMARMRWRPEELVCQRDGSIRRLRRLANRYSVHV